MIAKKIKGKEFFIVRKGLKYNLIRTLDIAFIYTQDDVTYIIDTQSRKFMSTEPLNPIESSLGRAFFRANRQFIINAYMIKSFFSYDKGKILVEMNIEHTNSKIVISKVTAPKFRNWLASF